MKTFRSSTSPKLITLSGIVVPLSAKMVQFFGPHRPYPAPYLFQADDDSFPTFTFVTTKSAFFLAWVFLSSSLSTILVHKSLFPNFVLLLPVFLDRGVLTFISLIHSFPAHCFLSSLHSVLVLVHNCNLQLLI